MVNQNTEKERKVKFILCCKSKKNGRIVSTADEEFGLTGLVESFSKSIASKDINIQDLRFADIFEVQGAAPLRIATFKRTKEGGLELIPTPNSKVNFYIRLLGVVGCIKTFIGYNMELHEMG